MPKDNEKNEVLEITRDGILETLFNTKSRDDISAKMFDELEKVAQISKIKERKQAILDFTLKYSFFLCYDLKGTTIKNLITATSNGIKKGLNDEIDIKLPEGLSGYFKSKTADSMRLIKARDNYTAESAESVFKGLKAILDKENFLANNKSSIVRESKIIKTFILLIATGRRMSEILKTIEIAPCKDKKGYVTYTGLLKKSENNDNFTNAPLLFIDEEVANQYLKDIRKRENKSIDELINIDEYDINKTSNKFSAIFKNAFLKYAKNNEFLKPICDDNFTMHKLRHAYTDYCIKTLKPENITDEAFAAEILGHEYAPSASTVYKQALENENKALENENQALKAEIEELKKSMK